jgi:hypothetical protein
MTSITDSDAALNPRPILKNGIQRVPVTRLTESASSKVPRLKATASEVFTRSENVEMFRFGVKWIAGKKATC